MTIAAEPVPLCTDESGTVRVGGTRVTLDTVVAFYEDGCSAEEIAYRLPALKLSDVHAALAYYLNHKTEVESYLAEGAAEAEHWRQVWEKRCPSEGLRARLLARQAKKAPSS